MDPIIGISGNRYSRRNNRPLLKLWRQYALRTWYWEELRLALIEEGVPASLMAQVGLDQAFVIMAIADGCPAHTLPPHLAGVYFQLRVWGKDTGRI